MYSRTPNKLSAANSETVNITSKAYYPNLFFNFFSIYPLCPYFRFNNRFFTALILPKYLLVTITPNTNVPLANPSAKLAIFS